ncbi:MAG TPA: hypothetical protein PKM63_19670 [Panacibacter sp.]|nr:hypothetical protein [Panacibacter sp.]HNP46524.1 hypothetical protein [Panacibacter sp.]
MLPQKLQRLKRDLESELYLDADDKKALQILKVLDSDPKFQQILNSSDFLTKSFSVAPRICPQCGKPI